MPVKYKKRAAGLIAFLAAFFICAAPAMPVYATSLEENVNSQIEEARDRLLEKMQESMDEDNYQRGEKLLDALDEAMDDDETVEDAKASIYYAVKKLDEEGNPDAMFITDQNFLILKNTWQDAFAEMTNMYGISDSGTEGADEVENASKKVNLLTWGTGEMGSDEDGAVMALLTRFDTLGASSEGGGSFSSIICGLAIALAITFSVSSMLTMITDRNLSGEAINREFMKLLFGVWFIYNYRWFALLIVYFGTSLVSLVMSTTEGSQINLIRKCVYDSLYAIVTQYGNNTFTMMVSASTGATFDLGKVLASIAGGIGELFSGVISFIGGGLTQLASSLTIYAVLLELGIRYFLTPIAIADLYSERFRSNGWMWLKKMFAVSMQGAIIFLVVFGTEALKNSLDSFDIITNTAINLTMIGLFAKSRSIANDVIGVH